MYVFTGFLIFILFGFFIIIVAVGISYLVYQNEAAQTSQWQSLAKLKQLTFSPSRYFPFNSKRTVVHGNYHDCRLTLTTILKSHGRSSVTYTQLSVQPRQRLTAAELVKLFPPGRPLAYSEINRLLGKYTLPHRQNRTEVSIVGWDQGVVYEERGIVTNTPYLERLFDFLTELAHTYIGILSLGGDAVPALHQIASDNSELLQTVALQLLRTIEKETTQRLKGKSARLFCPNCLTGCGPYELRLGWLTTLTFYGCRRCRQSRDFSPGPLVAVLDSQMETESVKYPDGVWVNWLRHRDLFDFGQVEIVQATDEEVERFAVQVGNDTDEGRRPHYSRMPCIVSAQCQLSENTLRILERIFGEVKVEGAPLGAEQILHVDRKAE